MPARRRKDGVGSAGCGRMAVAFSPALWTMLAWAVLLGQGGAEACPAPCSCLGNMVDCHGRGIHSIPKNIPRGTERL